MARCAYLSHVPAGRPFVKVPDPMASKALVLPGPWTANFSWSPVLTSKTKKLQNFLKFILLTFFLGGWQVVAATFVRFPLDGSKRFAEYAQLGRLAHSTHSVLRRGQRHTLPDRKGIKTKHQMKYFPICWGLIFQFYRLSAQGDTTIHCHEVSEDHPHLFPLSHHKCSTALQVKVLKKFI
jgi:hypothetical protein